MKIRTGFVSNSSSSSFVLNNRDKNCFDIAQIMIKLRNEEWKVWDDTDEAKKIDRKNLVGLKNIERAIKIGINENTPITFSTSNYDTFIMQSNGQILVSTSNNHGFYYLLSDFDELINPENRELFDDIADGFDISHLAFFWDCEKDIMSRSISYDEVEDHRDRYCKTHQYETLHKFPRSDLILCPECYSKQHEKYLDLMERLKEEKANRIKLPPKRLRLR